jgi:tripartite-type tricarboxylate transporter receptor subunit TctC
MRQILRIARMLAVGLPVVFMTTGPSRAQSSLEKAWPERTVRLIVPLPPGSPTDISARRLAERLAERWRQPVVVENKQGADGIPAVTTFISARDNHTLLFSFAGIITINPLLYDKLPYDPAKDLVPIAPVLDNFIGIAVTAALNVNSVADLVRAARAQPGKLNWSALPGIPNYLFLALLKNTELDMMRIAYRDFAPAYQDLHQGRLQIVVAGIPSLLAHREAATAKLLMVSSRQRSPQAPDVPTAAEAGYPDLTFDGTIGLYGWRDMPASLIARIAADVRVITDDAAFREQLVTSGVAPRTGTPAEFAAAIEEQRAKVAAIHQSTPAKPAQ